MNWAERLVRRFSRNPCRRRHEPRLRGLYVIECRRCGFIIAPDPRDAAWHHTGAPYICGAPNGTDDGCRAWVRTPDGTCSRHAGASRHPLP